MTVEEGQRFSWQRTLTLEDVEAFGETLVMYEGGAVQAVWPFKRMREHVAAWERPGSMQDMLARAGLLPRAPAAADTLAGAFAT